MRGIDRIVVGIDLGPQSETILAHAAYLARHHGAVLTIANVSEPYPGEEVWPSLLTVKWGEIRESIFASRIVQLEGLLSTVDTAGVADPTLRVVFGRTSLKLATLAETEQADLLVVAASRKSSLEQTLLGTTAENLIKQAKVPIWVAREPLPEQGLRRIIVAVDYSPVSLVAVEAATLLAREANAHIDLLHVYRDPADRLFAVASEKEREQYHQIVEESAKKMFDGFVREAVPSDLDDRDLVSTTLKSGTPWRTVVAHAEETGADLIVIGSRSDGVLEHMFLGSTATQVTRNASTSVLIVHP